MTQHIDLIDRLRCFDRVTCNDAANALEAQAREIEGLRAARMAYASEFQLDGEGEPDVGSIHQNIRAMKAEIERLRKDAALVAARERERCAQYMESCGRHGHAAAIRALNAEGEGNDRQPASN